MSTVTDCYEERAVETGVEQVGASGATRTVTPVRITTTLYELIAALQSVAEPDEDALVVASIVDGLRSGRITFLGDTTLLKHEELAS